MSWASKLSKPYRIDSGKNFKLKHFDPASTAHVRSKEDAEELLAKSIAEMTECQDRLYAQDRWAILLIFQAAGIVERHRASNQRIEVIDAPVVPEVDERLADELARLMTSAACLRVQLGAPRRLRRQERGRR